MLKRLPIIKARNNGKNSCRRAAGKVIDVNYSYLIVVLCKWLATATVILLSALNIKQVSQLLILLLGIYNVMFSFYILGRRVDLKHKLILLGTDFLICISLIFITGGWASPFFQYGLSFLMLSALLLDLRGAGLSIILYGISYFIALNLNSFGLDKIVANGYLDAFITDYAIFVAVGLASVFIFSILDSSSPQVFTSESNILDGERDAEQLQKRFSFTPQEEKVAVLLVAGLTYEQIAAELSVSINTIKFHVKNIYCKLGVDCRAKALVVLVDTSIPVPPIPKAIPEEKA